jgi:hypothetical protein
MSVLQLSKSPNFQLPKYSYQWINGNNGNIYYSGNVGINTRSDPQYNLDVSGTSNISGNIIIRGNLTTINDVSFNGNLVVGGAITGSYLSTGTGGITGGYITGSTLYVGTGGITGGYISGSTLAVTGTVSGAYITAPEISTGSSGNMATGILRIYNDDGNGLEINSGNTNNNKWLINHYKTERILKFRAWEDTGVGWKSNHAFAIYGNGDIRAEGRVYANGSQLTSDYRLKKNVQLLSETNKSIDELKPIEYDLSGGNHDMGFLAHEVQEIFPFLVNGEKDGKDFQSLNYIGFIALLVKEMQELKQRVYILENKNM